MMAKLLLYFKNFFRKNAFRVILKESKSSLCDCFNRLNGVFFGSPISLEWDDKTSNYRIKEVSSSQTEVILYNSRKERLHLYFSGIGHRVNSLANKYFIPNIDINDGDTIIDCGANVGEIGKYFDFKGLNVDYHAFDPSNAESISSLLNNPYASINQKGLWNETCKLPLYEKNETADSSFIEFSGHHNTVNINVVKLDDYVLENNISSIKLLKLEAEGAEPEILEGAKNILNRIEWISADCGPERGVSKEMTFKFVINFLLNNGFQVEALNPNKKVVLFSNKLLNL